MTDKEKTCSDCGGPLTDPCSECKESPFDLPLNCAGCQWQYNSPYCIPEYKQKVLHCKKCKTAIIEVNQEVKGVIEDDND